MLTRRHIRIKVLQSLYAFVQNEGVSGAKALSELEKSLTNIYRLYLLDLQVLRQLVYFLEERKAIEEKKQFSKQALVEVLETAISHPFLIRLADDNDLVAALEIHRVHFGDASDVVRKLLFDYWQSDLAKTHFNENEPLTEGWLKQFYGQYVAGNESLHAVYEGMELHWADDLEAAQMMVVKTMKNLRQNKPLLVNLYKDKEDAQFGKQLLVKVLDDREDWEKRLIEKSTHWDIDRMALIDRLLVEIALSELVGFPEVPPRVTINEALDVAKEYSTPKSSAFVNGLIDSIFADLKAEGKVQKFGRGLL
jgi:N utilization substance protein B